MLRFRHWWLKLHRWFALSLGWVLILCGLSGALLVVAQPLDRWAHPQLFKAQTAAALGTVPVDAPLQPILQRLQAQFPAKAKFTFRPAVSPGDTLEVRVAGPWKGSLYLDPATGLEQGRRGASEGAFNLLFKLHSSLLLQAFGKTALAVVALIYTLLLLTGLILWWPKKWPPILKPELRKGLMRALFDLHRMGGAVLGVLILVSVCTGAYMAWRPLGGVINLATGSETFVPPPLPANRAATAPLQSLDVLAQNARQVWPGARLAVLPVPTSSQQLLRLRMWVPGEPHPFGVSAIWMDPVTGKVQAARRWNELDPGTGAVAVLFPLHAGKLGGVLHELVMVLIGLALGGLGISGLWLWWRRRQIRRQAEARQRQTAATTGQPTPP